MHELKGITKDFKVYVSCGFYDLATPCFTAENFMYDNTVDMSRVVFSEFEAGHMMYNHQPSFDRFLKEVRNLSLVTSNFSLVIFLE